MFSVVFLLCSCTDAFCCCCSVVARFIRHVARNELLLPNPSVRPFIDTESTFTETDPEYYLLPSKIELNAPQTR